MWEILALAEDNGWTGSSKAERAVDFWIWCGLKPERWALVPDQGLWEEFSEECELHKYKGQCERRTERKGTGKVSIGFLAFINSGSFHNADWIATHAHDIGRAN